MTNKEINTDKQESVSQNRREFLIKGSLSTLGLVLLSKQSAQASPFDTKSDIIQKIAQEKRLLEQLKEDISNLASAPRFSTKQYSQAIEYVQKQAQAIGLDVVIEPVSGISDWERGTSDYGELLLSTSVKQPVQITALTNSAAGEIDGEIVLVNYFFDKNQGAPPRHFNEGNKKRIVFFSRPLERTRSLDGYIKTVVQRNHGASWAAKYGAAAVLVRSVQTGDGPPHAGAVTYAKEAPQIPAAVLSIDDADKLEKLIAKGIVSAHLKIAPNRVKRQQSNVVIRIPGTTLSKEIILLGAHLDSHDITPGAADDAAGVASVLAVMRRFAKNPPARTILIVLFADEEVNFSGGPSFIENYREELPNIVAAIEMDDGDGVPRALQITSSEKDYKSSLTTLRRIADSVGQESHELELLADTAAYGADIEALWNDYRIPEIAILQDLTKYFDKHHSANDTPENIDFVGLGQTTSLLIRVLEILCSEDSPLVFRTVGSK
jgi:carboxypeptidase Q